MSSPWYVEELVQPRGLIAIVRHLSHGMMRTFHALPALFFANARISLALDGYAYKAEMYPVSMDIRIIISTCIYNKEEQEPSPPLLQLLLQLQLQHQETPILDKRPHPRPTNTSSRVSFLSHLRPISVTSKSQQCHTLSRPPTWESLSSPASTGSTARIFPTASSRKYPPIVLCTFNCRF